MPTKHKEKCDFYKKYKQIFNFEKLESGKV